MRIPSCQGNEGSISTERGEETEREKATEAHVKRSRWHQCHAMVHANRCKRATCIRAYVLWKCKHLPKSSNSDGGSDFDVRIGMDTCIIGFVSWCDVDGRRPCVCVTRVGVGVMDVAGMLSGPGRERCCGGRTVRGIGDAVGRGSIGRGERRDSSSRREARRASKRS